MTAGALIAVAALASCSAQSEPARAPAPADPPVAAANPVPNAGPSPTPTRSRTRAPDPIAPATDKPVGRMHAAKSRVSAPKGSLTSGLRYRDGVRITVSDIAQATTTAQGPGSVTGQPKTSFALRLDNGSRTAVDVSQVVVRLTYGSSPARLAPPVYGTGAEDFAGTVAPGGSTTATYAFSIPSNKLSRVGLSVDLDASHAPAVMNGSAR